MNDSATVQRSDPIATLNDFQLLDTPAEEAFDVLVSLAAEVFDVPIALISLLDRDRQWFKAEYGLGVRELPLETAFCATAIHKPELLIVEDATLDPRFARNPLVTGSTAIRFYAGAPLRAANGSCIGALCVLDRRPRRFDARQCKLLCTLASQVMRQIEARKALLDARAAVRHHLRAERHLRVEARRKDEFLAMLAHELRSPLAPITTVLEVLRRTDEGHNPSLLWARRVMTRQTQHLTRLVDDLLDVARVTEGKIALHMAPVSLGDVVQHALETVQPLLEARGQQWHVSGMQTPVHVTGDAVRLSQIVANLLNNAAKYTPEGGTIHLSMARDDGNAVIRVRDNGVGIARADLSRIFRLFAQTDGSLQCSAGIAEGGLGIGLTLARRLAQLHGGDLSAASEGPGRGSEFTLTLPTGAGPVLRRPPTSNDRPAPGDGPDPRAETRTADVAHALRVLVVDDNRDSAESMSMLLRLLGHEVLTAFDGPDALTAAQTGAPDVVLCDIGLPRMSGYDVARSLRARSGPHAPLLIAMTGYGQESDRLAALQAGFDHHLVKPVDMTALEGMLADYAGRKRSLT